MPLPLNINELINGTTVEWERIEFKEGWNDLDILHTICAFANDFSNLGGGYVVIGIAEQDGKPILPPKGLTPAQANKIQSDLLNLCKQKLNPTYTPIVEPITFQDKLILIIWCPGGQERPYVAPDGITKGIKHYFIRKFRNTIKPNKTEKEELLRFAEVPFDDRINYNKQLKDLLPGLIRSFLQEIKSKLFDDFDTLPFKSICRQMNLVEGSDEYIKPKNFALMFFNDHPEKIFPKAQIEIVNFKTNVADKDFTETNLEGPIHHQLRDALRYLKTQVIKEKVKKVSYQPQAIRNFNFPYEALGEALANAVYHRSYETAEPIEIRIHPNRIHIISYPGPDASVKIEDMQNGLVVARRYLNRQIGNILKELKLTEGKCTGIPTILKSMKNNGSPRPLFETDEFQQSLKVTFPVHPAFEDFEFSNLNITPTAYRILEICFGRVLSASGIAKELKVQVGSGGFRRGISQLLSEGLIAYTLPDNPTSRLQKYVLTNKGEQYWNNEAANMPF